MDQIIGRNAVLVHYERSGNPAVKIRFPFNTDDLDRVRSLPDRKWNPDGKFWITPLNIEVVEKLQEWKFAIDPQLVEYLQKTKFHVDQVDEIEVPGLKGSLYPFQKRGVSFIEAKQGRALIADEMGLGKTIQSLAWLQLHIELRPVIIVVPASLKLNWAREAGRWMPTPGVQILSGTTPSKIHGWIIIINYDILSYWLKELQVINAKVLILDEVHYVKNNAANRTKATKKLAKNIPHVIALSGTPIVNRPVEVYNAIRMINPTIVPSFWEYAHRYCAARNNGYGWDFSGASNTEELHNRLVGTIMIRRRKEDVLPDLPKKVRAFIPIELDNTKEYEAAEQDFIAFITKQKGVEAAERAGNAQALAEIEGLKQLAVKGKLKNVTTWIKDFIEVDGKLVVFAHHAFVIDALMNEFKNVAVKVDGSVTGVNRQKAVDEFQTNPNIRLFIGNIQAAGVGITLTAASNAAFIELPWTPGALVQAEDRLHRIGQRNSVTVHYLLAADTIEERIARLIDYKRKVLDSVLDGRKTEQESLLNELMKEYNV